MDTVAQPGLEAVAREALARLDWRTAAIMFTAAADAIPVDSAHCTIPARAQSLRRDAHLALCRSEEFKNYRESARKRGLRDFRAEWETPSGELVTRLLQAKRRA